MAVSLKPDYLVKAEAEQARLQAKQAKLRKALADGKLSRDEYDRRHARVLMQETEAELVVKAYTIAWETFTPGGEDPPPPPPRTAVPNL